MGAAGARDARRRRGRGVAVGARVHGRRPAAERHAPRAARSRRVGHGIGLKSSETNHVPRPFTPSWPKFSLAAAVALLPFSLVSATRGASPRARRSSEKKPRFQGKLRSRVSRPRHFLRKKMVLGRSFRVILMKVHVSWSERGLLPWQVFLQGVVGLCSDVGRLGVGWPGFTSFFRDAM